MRSSKFVPQDRAVAALYAALRCRFGDPWGDAYDNSAAVAAWSAALERASPAEIRKMVRHCIDRPANRLPTPAEFSREFVSRTLSRSFGPQACRTEPAATTSQIQLAQGRACLAALRRLLLAGQSANEPR